MQKGSKSGGGQGLPDRAAEEQATTRGRKRVRKAFQGRIFLRACFRFCPGTAYIVFASFALNPRSIDAYGVLRVRWRSYRTDCVLSVFDVLRCKMLLSCRGGSSKAVVCDFLAVFGCFQTLLMSLMDVPWVVSLLGSSRP